MSKQIVFLILAFLATACAPATRQEPEKLTVRNPIGIVMKNKNALTVETSVGPVSFCTFDAKNVPPNRRFYLQSSDLVCPAYPPIELLSDEYGCLRTAADRSLSLKNHVYSMQFLLPGEMSSAWLLSEDKSIVVRTSFVPYPLEAFGSDGAELSVVRLVKDASRVECRGRYFNANEKLKIHSATKEKQTIDTIQCYKGGFTLDLAAPDPKSFGGIITLTITRENGEKLSLSYPFGRESFNKDLLCGNVAKLKDEDHDKIDDALEAYYKGTSSDTLI